MSEPKKYDFHAVVADLSDLDDKTREHIAAAVAFTRKREPVLQANSSRKSERIECAQCGVGIRKETTPIAHARGAMHPKCARVADDATFAAKMPVNSHAARSAHDSRVLPTLREEEKARHAALLARIEREDAEIAAADAAKKAAKSA